MNIRGLLFDINGTLIDINTNEESEEIYRVLSNFLSYQGIIISPESMRSQYFQIMKEQRNNSLEHHPEFNVVGIFTEIVARKSSDFTRRLPSEKLAVLPLLLAEIFRAVSRYRLKLYQGVRETLDTLHPYYRLAALSDAQTPWAVPELYSVDLLAYFSPIVVSGDLGFRKPDTRIFQQALDGMGMTAAEVLFVGNDMYRDVYGAQQLGIKTVFFRSNQGEHAKNGVSPDYIIYNFPELLQAISFFGQQG